MQQTKEIYALNCALWEFVQETARANRDAATRSFGLPIETLVAISQSNSHRLRRLCSETLVFFCPRKCETLTWDEETTAQDDERHQTLDAETEFAQLWWLSLGKLATSDPLTSAQIFGISVRLAEQVATTPIQQIRQFSIIRHAGFNLRFDPACIKPILQGQTIPTCLFLKIHQQALSRSVSGITKGI